MKGNPAYPDPPADLELLNEQTDRLSASLVAVRENGGKRAMAQRQDDERILGEMLRDLARYVESKCNGDMTAFLSSGFKAVSNDRARTLPLSETIRLLTHAERSGEARIRLVDDPDALNCQVRWAESDGLVEPAPEAWMGRGRSRLPDPILSSMGLPAAEPMSLKCAA